MATKILIVEDDIDALNMYSELLRDAGYDIKSAADGREAIESINGYRPDLILLDVMLPNVNGLEVARQLKNNDTSSIPIIIITALTVFPPTRESLGNYSNIKRVIFKPCRPKTLLEGIDDVLKAKH